MQSAGPSHLIVDVSVVFVLLTPADPDIPQEVEYMRLSAWIYMAQWEMCYSLWASVEDNPDVVPC